MKKLYLLLLLIPIFLFLPKNEVKAADNFHGWYTVTTKEAPSYRLSATTSELKILPTGNNTEQKLLITPVGNGLYSIKTGFTAGKLTIDGTSYSGSKSQQWQIIKNSDNSYSFKNKSDGKVLGYKDAVSNKPVVKRYKLNVDDVKQKFLIQPVANKYTVTFTNGENVIKRETVAKNKSATAPTNPTKTGYKFSKWDISFSKVTKNLTVRPKWEANTITVNFYPNKATGDSLGTWDSKENILDTRVYSYDGTALAKNGLPNTNGGTWKLTKPGYYPTNMYLVGSASSKTKINQDNLYAKVQDFAKEINKDITQKNQTLNLYAEMLPIEYSVKFNGNGATSGSMSDQLFTYDKEQELAINKFKRNGYSFGGWAVTSKGEAKYQDKEKVKNLTTTSNITLYATWLKEGLYKENGETYYYVKGVKQKGLHKIDGKWYLFDITTGKYTGENNNNIYLATFFNNNTEKKGNAFFTLDGKTFHKINTGSFTGRDMSFIYKENKFYGVGTKGAGRTYAFFTYNTDNFLSMQKMGEIKGNIFSNLDELGYMSVWAPEFLVDYDGNTTGSYVYFCAKDVNDVYGDNEYRWKIYRTKVTDLHNRTFQKPQLCKFDDFNDTISGSKKINSKTSYHMIDPAVIKVNGQYIMAVKWGGNGANSEHTDIYTSKDGLNWNKKKDTKGEDVKITEFFGGPITEKIQALNDKILTGNKDDNYAAVGWEGGTLAYIDGTYYLYIDHYVWTANNGDECYKDDNNNSNGMSYDGKIHYATSKDLITWEYKGIIEEKNDITGETYTCRHGSVNIIKDAKGEDIIKNLYNN